MMLMSFFLQLIRSGSCHPRLPVALEIPANFYSSGDLIKAAFMDSSTVSAKGSFQVLSLGCDCLLVPLGRRLKPMMFMAFPLA